MAILKSKEGDLYTSYETINRWVAPNEIGPFPISKEAAAMAARPLDEKSTIKIYQEIPKELDSKCRRLGLSPTKSFTVWEGSDLKIKEKIKISMAPHINHGNKAHFFFAGSLVFYINAAQLFALILQAGEWIYIDGSTEHWIKQTAESFFTIASYHSAPISPIDEFHKKRVFTKTPPDYSIL